MPQMRIGLIGAGVIGRTHAATITASQNCTLAAIADPSDAGRALAGELGAAWYPDLAAMLDGETLHGVIVATPNDLHLPNALEAMARGIPVLVEKPVTTTVEQGQALAAASSGLAGGVCTLKSRRC